MMLVSKKPKIMMSASIMSSTVTSSCHLRSTRQSSVLDFSLSAFFKGKKLPPEVLSRIGMFLPATIVSKHTWAKLVQSERFLNFLHTYPLFRALQSHVLYPAHVKPSIRNLHQCLFQVGEQMSASLPLEVTRGVDVLDLPIHPEVGRMRIVKQAIMFLSESYVSIDNSETYTPASLASAMGIVDGMITYPLLNTHKWEGVISSITVFPKESGTFLRAIEFRQKSGESIIFCGLVVSSTENTKFFYLPIHKSRAAGIYSLNENFSWVYTIFSQNGKLSSDYLRRCDMNPYLEHRHKQMTVLSKNGKVENVPLLGTLIRSASHGSLNGAISPALPGRSMLGRVSPSLAAHSTNGSASPALAARPKISSGRCTPTSMFDTPFPPKTSIITLT
jgi:hypothetical protein